TKRDGLPNENIRQVRYASTARAGLASDRDAVYVAIQGGGVAILDPDSFELRALIDTRDGLPDNNAYVTLDVVAGPLAGLGVGGPQGLAHRRPGERRFSVVMRGETYQERTIHHLYFDSERATLWVGTDAGLVQIHDLQQPPAPVSEVRGFVQSIVQVRRRKG